MSWLRRAEKTVCRHDLRAKSCACAWRTGTDSYQNKSVILTGTLMIAGIKNGHFWRPWRFLFPGVPGSVLTVMRRAFLQKRLNAFAAVGVVQVANEVIALVVHLLAHGVDGCIVDKLLDAG